MAERLLGHGARWKASGRARLRPRRRCPWESASPSAPRLSVGKRISVRAVGVRGRARLRPRRRCPWEGAAPSAPPVSVGGRGSVRAAVRGEVASPSAPPVSVGGRGSVRAVVVRGRARLRPCRRCPWKSALSSAPLGGEKNVPLTSKQVAFFLHLSTSKVIENHRKCCLNNGNAFLAERGITLMRVVGWGMAIPINKRAQR